MIYNFLSNVSADNAETLTLPSHDGIDHQPVREQYVEVLDDGSEERIDADNVYQFTTTIKWIEMSKENHQIIMDYFYSATKGAGITETFYWEHPSDGHAYTVRFEAKPQQVQKPNHVYDVTAKLRIVGNQP